MALQFATTLRNNFLDEITAYAGASALLRIYSGSAPADCATAASGTLLAELTCNATFAAAASGGVLTLNAITSDSSANATGTAGYFRLVKSDGTTVVLQGTVTATGGGGDLTIDNTAISSGVSVSVTSATITAPGA